MASTDRAFRALARSDPAAVLALLRVALPALLAEVSPDTRDVVDPKLDIPPPYEADLVALAGSEDLLHVEGQGYGERTFGDRIFRYHLILVLRFPERRVHSVALWLTRPPRGQRLDRLGRSGVEVLVHTVVLAELSATLLLERAQTACFAVGAAAEGMSDAELCRRVAEALRNQSADWQHLLLCMAAAAAAGRYDTMVEAMHELDLEPPIIEDLVLFGRDRGRAEGVELGRAEGVELGRAEGVELGERRSLLALIDARGLALTPEQRARIESEHDAERLLSWIRNAVTAQSASEIFGV